jgi:hypothetical protein
VNYSKNKELQAGDIINIKGTGDVSKIIQWLTDYEYSHTATLCCRLGSGEYIVIEMLSEGCLIRPLSIYKNNKIEVYRLPDQNSKELGKKMVLAIIDLIPKASYGFKKIFYLGLILLPRRLFNRKACFRIEGYDRKTRKIIPKGIYQKICYFLTKIISTITLMDYWTYILRSFSKNMWITFTQNVYIKVEAIRTINGKISYDEFVKIVEKEMEYIR